MERKIILSPELSRRTREVWRLRNLPVTLEDLGKVLGQRWRRRLATGHFDVESLFSLTETRHQVQFGNQVRYTRCALDALILPQITGQGVRLSSSCPHCGEMVNIKSVKGNLLSNHAEAVLSLGFSRVGKGPAPLIACPFINVFPSGQHYSAWAEHSPEALTVGLSLREVSFLLGELAKASLEHRQGEALQNR